MQWWVARRARAHQSWPPIAPNNITIHNKKNKIKKWCNVRVQNLLLDLLDSESMQTATQIATLPQVKYEANSTSKTGENWPKWP